MRLTSWMTLLHAGSDSLTLVVFTLLSSSTEFVYGPRGRSSCGAGIHTSIDARMWSAGGSGDATRAVKQLNAEVQRFCTLRKQLHLRLIIIAGSMHRHAANI